jgi:group I intron endonuclease
MGTVYLITNKVNGKYYVGQTIQPLRHRYTYHLASALNGKGCRALGNAIRKYGKTHFNCTILAECGSHDELDQLERAWIVALDARNPEIGYNCTIGGECGTRGAKHSEASRLKRSLYMKGNTRRSGGFQSPETKAKIRRSLIGHAVPQEVRDKIAATLRAKNANTQ